MIAGRHLGTVIVASLGGLLFGFDTAVISGVTRSLREVFVLAADDPWFGAAIASALVGTLIGALVMGMPGDRFGTRDTLKVVGLLYVISAVGCAFTWSLGSFIAFRFIGGIAIGGSSVLVPVYITEIVPANRRGALTGLFQFNIVLGILLAYVSNFIVQQLTGGADAWRWKLAVAAVPAALFLILLYTIPQSPRWLVLRARLDEAATSLKQLGIADPAPMIEEFRRAASGAGHARLSWQRHRRPIVLAIVLAMFNQLSGINSILYYLNDIFAAAGFSSWSGDLQAVAIGAANLAATLLALTVIDKVGRKRLLLIGAVGTALAQAGVAVIMSTQHGQSLLIWMLTGFIGFFAFSQGAVIWVYLSEIFPTAVRARGQSIGSATHWAMNAVLQFAFPYVAAHTRALPFVFFAACMALQFVVVAAFFPETRGVELESMESAIEARRT